MVIHLITGLSGKMLICNVLVELVGSAEDKEDHSFLETCLVVHPLLGGGSSDWGSD